MNTVGNEDGRKKPLTNVVHGRHCLWEKAAFPLGNISFFPLGNYILSP